MKVITRPFAAAGGTRTAIDALSRQHVRPLLFIGNSIALLVQVSWNGVGNAPFGHSLQYGEIVEGNGNRIAFLATDELAGLTPLFNSAANGLPTDWFVSSL